MALDRKGLGYVNKISEIMLSAGEYTRNGMPLLLLRRSIGTPAVSPASAKQKCFRVVETPSKLSSTSTVAIAQRPRNGSPRRHAARNGHGWSECWHVRAGTADGQIRTIPNT